MNLKLSVLDQSPIHDSKEDREGLLDTVELAKHCESLGYSRYWLAEHHNTPGYASCAPEIMVSVIAGATSSIRVGSGGIMLNHYSPFKTAETFSMLEAIYPDRIDLGIGRASGANFMTARALHDGRGVNYSQKAYELIGFLNNTLPESHPFADIGIKPYNKTQPPVFLLGSSEGSSELAGVLGAGFVLALFIGTHERSNNILQSYKQSFRPSKDFKQSKGMIAVACICADNYEEAKKIASTHAYWKVQAFRHTTRDPLQDPEVVKDLVEKLSEDDKAYYEETLDTMILGTPKECRKKIEELAEYYGVDEVMIVNVTYSFEDRKRSYELLSKEFKLKRS